MVSSIICYSDTVLSMIEMPYSSVPLSGSAHKLNKVSINEEVALNLPFFIKPNLTNKRDAIL